jgi:molybdopterin converting factor small subunit
MKVHIPSPLRSYTSQQACVEAEGQTVADLLNRLDQQYPGVRFRMINEQDSIREHIKIFVNQTQISDLSVRLNETDAIYIIAALSGG